MKQVTRILQITDLHLLSNPQTKLIGVNTFQTLQHVIAKVTNDIAQNKPDLIVLSGDISQDYSLASYKTTAKIFQDFRLPLAATMGNHDYLPMFTEVFGKPSQLVTEISNAANWRIIILNSHWPKHVDGKLADSELVFLQESLATGFDQPTIIFIHHHVLPIDSYWIDKIGLHNSQQFLEIIDRYKNIKAVICGHVHQDTTTSRKDVLFISTPSTNLQFAVKSHEFKLDTLMPGYRWINLYEDGTIQTDVVRIEHNDAFIPDENSNGY